MCFPRDIFEKQKIKQSCDIHFEQGPAKTTFFRNDFQGFSYFQDNRYKRFKKLMNTKEKKRGLF